MIQRLALICTGFNPFFYGLGRHSRGAEEGAWGLEWHCRKGCSHAASLVDNPLSPVGSHLMGFCDVQVCCPPALLCSALRVPHKRLAPAAGRSTTTVLIAFAIDGTLLDAETGFVRCRGRISGTVLDYSVIWGYVGRLANWGMNWTFDLSHLFRWRTIGEI
jgi:hypothetical protein